MPELAKHPRYKVGDQLQPKWRGPRWVGTVTEARGTYSADGHVLYNVRVPMEPEAVYLLLREEEVADPAILARFAEEVHRLMDRPNARERFLSRCHEYFLQRNDNDRPPPMALVAAGRWDELTIAEKYALLAALHAALHAGEAYDPVVKPDGLSWEEFANADRESYRHAIRWAALVDRVKEWLAPKNANEIQSWIDAAQEDLQDLQNGLVRQG